MLYPYFDCLPYRTRKMIIMIIRSRSGLAQWQAVIIIRDPINPHALIMYAKSVIQLDSTGETWNFTSISIFSNLVLLTIIKIMSSLVKYILIKSYFD